jgi:hypothetical protein
VEEEAFRMNLCNNKISSFVQVFSAVKVISVKVEVDVLFFVQVKE